MHQRGQRRIYAIYTDSVKSVKDLEAPMYLTDICDRSNKNVTKMHKKLHLWLKEKRISVILVTHRGK